MFFGHQFNSGMLLGFTGKRRRYMLLDSFDFRRHGFKLVIASALFLFCAMHNYFINVKHLSNESRLC